MNKLTQIAGPGGSIYGERRSQHRCKDPIVHPNYNVARLYCYDRGRE